MYTWIWQQSHNKDSKKATNNNGHNKDSKKMYVLQNQ